MGKKLHDFIRLVCAIPVTGWCGDASAVEAEGNDRDRSFDSGWRFLRADAPDAEVPDFDDSAWRQLDLRHDWSIEDLPPVANSVPKLPVVKGQWPFQKGDDAACKGNEFDLLPDGTGDVDETFLNGRCIGGTGPFPPNYHTAWAVQRRYRVSASFVRGEGSDVLAVRVFNGSGAPNDESSFRVPLRATYPGRYLAILRPYGDAGKITLTAEADGLEPLTIKIQTQ